MNQISAFVEEFMTAAKQGPRLFFAPLYGAFSAVRAEIHSALRAEHPSLGEMQSAVQRKPKR